MLTRLSRNTIGLCLGSSIFLHAAVLWKEWWAIPIGFPDFCIFYTAGTILRDGKGAQLYDQKLQQAVQHSFAAGGIANRGSILPYFHPPFEAVFFVPLTHFSYLTAYFLWMAVNLAMVVTLSLKLRQELPALASLPSWFWWLAGLGFSPIFIALVQGQDSILLLFCYTMAFLALRRNSDMAAGSWLALGLVKYHLLLPFLLAFLWQRRAKVIAGFLIGLAVLGVIAFVGVGWQGLRSYPQYVWQSEHSSMYRWNNFHGNTTNLRGLLLTEVPGGELPQNTATMRGLLIVGSLVVLGIAGKAWAGLKSFKSPEGELGFALNLVATLLVSYHAFIQDMSLLFLAMLLVLNVLFSHPEIEGWRRRVLLICAAIMVCTPVYLVLILTFSQLSAITWVVLVFFAVLVSSLSVLHRNVLAESQAVS
jgi:hypothetical protein